VEVIKVPCKKKKRKKYKGLAELEGVSFLDKKINLYDELEKY